MQISHRPSGPLMTRAGTSRRPVEFRRRSVIGIGSVPAVAGQGTSATTLLRREQVAFALHSYHHDARSTSYGAEAAAALGVDPARVFKTLMANVDGRLTVGVVPVSASLDLKAVATATGGKRAAMAEPAAAQRATGYVADGISPLGQRSRLPTAVDVSAGDWPTVFVSAGRRGLQIELSPADLVRLTSATLAPIASS
jgi:Cys-tRNA(Pro)/Cys-tRNA(Cys) deacylase